MKNDNDFMDLRLDDLIALGPDESLAHHGIKGQKWGVRRFQNADRTWTAEGKIRYGSGRNERKNSHKVLLGSASKKVTNEDLQKKVTDIDHNKAGSNKGEIAKLALNVGLDLITLNPIGAAQDIVRIGQAAAAGIGEKAAERRKANAEIDEESGLPLKKRDMGADYDVRAVNPGFHNFNTNTKNNCVLCSTAFELRRRGFDVTAEKAAIGYNHEEYTKWFKGATMTSKGGLTLASSLGVPSIVKGRELFEWANPKLLAQGNGARGYLSVLLGPAAGHSMAYEVQGDKVIVYDAQCGKKKSLRSVMNASVDVGFTRLDNLEPDYEAMRKAGVIQ